MNEKLVSAATAILAKEGDSDELFRILFDESKQVTLSVIRRYTHATAEYEDILQETYIQVYKKIHMLQDSRKVQAWINRIAANIAIRTGMKQNSMMFTDLEDEDGQMPEVEDESGYYNPEQIVEQKEVARIVTEILDALPEDQRAALWMVYGQQVTIKEMAENLGISENTIKSRLYQGRQKLVARKSEFKKAGIELALVPISALVAMAFHENVYAASAGFAAGTSKAGSSGEKMAAVRKRAEKIEEKLKQTAKGAAKKIKESESLRKLSRIGGQCISKSITTLSGLSVGAKAIAAGSAVLVMAVGGTAVGFAGSGSYMDPIKEKINGYNHREYTVAVDTGVYYPEEVVKRINKLLKNDKGIDVSNKRRIWGIDKGDQYYTSLYVADAMTFDRVYGKDWKITYNKVSTKKVTEKELKQIRQYYENNTDLLYPKSQIMYMFNWEEDEKEKLDVYLAKLKVTKAYHMELDMKIEGSNGSGKGTAEVVVVKYGNEWVLYSEKSEDLVFTLDFYKVNEDAEELDSVEETDAITEPQMSEKQQENETSETSQEELQPLQLNQEGNEYDNERNRAAIAAYQDALLHRPELQPTEDTSSESFAVMDADSDGVMEAVVFLHDGRWGVQIYTLTYSSELKINETFEDAQGDLAVLPGGNRIITVGTVRDWHTGTLFDFSDTMLQKLDAYKIRDESEFTLDSQRDDNKVGVQKMYQWLANADFCTQVALTEENIQRYLSGTGELTGMTRLDENDYGRLVVRHPFEKTPEWDGGREICSVEQYQMGEEMSLGEVTENNE
ncbi:MAG: sigma-70 family RNA polymerase sigma factor [Lachnospiraceae bacterium]|nr:sigma-70 family RNA polymerase sigma factor [Lachnospiraceae bacterium]